MGADATLVNAAYASAMANVPGDWSKIFNKQYEGLLLAHTAKWGAFGDAFEKIGEEGKEIAQAATERQQAWEDKITDKIDNIWETLGVDSITPGELAVANTKQSVDENQNHYQDGGPSNVGMFIAVQERFENIKNKIQKINKKKFPSKKEKQERILLYKNFDVMKRGMINDKAAAIQFHKANIGGVNGLIDWDRMARMADNQEIDLELISLLKDVHDPNIDFEKAGITVRFNDKNEKIIDYFEGRLGIQYNMNNGGSMYNMMTYGTAQNVKSIKYKDLMKTVKYKATAEETKIGEILDGVAAEATAVKKGTKIPVNKSWTNKITGGLKSKTRKSIIAELKNGDVINFLATNPMLGTERVYANDIAGYIDVLTYQDILGKDVSKFDINKDGEINRKELSAIGKDVLSNEDKTKIKEALINPKTDKELISAQNEYADYLTNIAEQHFNNNRPPSPRKNKVGVPWAPRLPKDEFERKAFALVDAVNKEQKTIRDKDKDVWTKETATKWGEEPTVTYVNSDKTKRKSKIEMIQHVGQQTIYGNIPNDWDWNSASAKSAINKYLGK